jgi:glutamine synthetase
VCGDCYSNDKLPEIPKSLRAATEKLAGSEMLKKALGPAVVVRPIQNQKK